MAAPAVQTTNLTKEFVRRHAGRVLVYRIWSALHPRHRPTVLRALDRVTFRLEKGKTLGIIGANGSGKSTLLRIIAGITEPSSGSVQTDGRMASLLELGAGFEHRLTARENVFLNGALIGMARDELRRRFDAILAYAELESHVDAPLHTFSSGMVVRLAFAIAVHARADILLLDEVLAVGDVAFQAKCLRTIQQFKTEGKTILFVSHDLYAIANVCDEVLLLDHGQKAALGDPADVIQRYWCTILEEESRATLEAGQLRVFFLNGRISAWWGATQLTKGFCGYTSVRHFVRWHESNNATWRVVERTATCIVAEGSYWGLPASQRWVLQLVGNRLLWEVTMTLTAELRFEREQANFMFCEPYDHFSSSAGARGELGEFRRSVDDDWDVRYSVPAGGTSISLVSAESDLPEVRFECDAGQADYALNVVNSDANFRGRLLQCRREPGNEEKSVGEYRFFAGSLTIGS